MADINQFMKAYSSFVSTFKLTSYDSENGVYLCKDETQKVVDFDKIIEVKYHDSNKRPKTFDALYFDEKSNRIYCVEFKNEKKPDKEEIEGKLIDGINAFSTLLKELHISPKNYQYIFCLVYNPFKPKEERFKRGLYKSIRFEFLNRYKKDGIVDEIFTEDVDFFTKQFKKNFQKELMC